MPQRFRALLSRRFEGKAGLNFCRERENPHLSSPLRMSVAVVAHGMGVFTTRTLVPDLVLFLKLVLIGGNPVGFEDKVLMNRECASTASLRYNHDQALGIPK